MEPGPAHQEHGVLATGPPRKSSPWAVESSSFLFFGGGGWLHWVFAAIHGLSPVAVSRGYSSLWCAGSSLLQSTSSREWARYLWHTGSLVPLHVGSSGPGVEPMFPELAGGLPTTGPSGKPESGFFCSACFWNSFTLLYISAVHSFFVAKCYSIV